MFKEANAVKQAMPRNIADALQTVCHTLKWNNLVLCEALQL